MKIIKVLISAPSDQDKEVKEVFDAISDFNDLMNKRGISFTPIHWQKNIATGQAKRAQDVINDQVDDCDMIIAIVGTRMGTATGKADSGTAEEVFDFCNSNGFSNTSYNTHVFFNTFYDGNVLQLEADQLLKVQKFQTEITELGVLYAPFSNLSTLRKLVNQALDSFYFQSQQTQLVSLKETEIEELGLEDYLDEASKNLESITSLVGSIADHMVEFSEEAAQATALSDQDEILTKGTEAMDKLAERITENVQNSQATLDQAYSNMNGGLRIAVEDFLNEQNIDDLSDLIDNLRVMVSSGREGQAGMQTLEETIMSLPRRNKKLIKSRKRVLLPISTLNRALFDFNNNVEFLLNEVGSAVDEYKSKQS